MTRVKSASQGVTGQTIFLGGAAPLSSRKTGYLLRVAHMIHELDKEIFSLREGGHAWVLGQLVQIFGSEEETHHRRRAIRGPHKCTKGPQYSRSTPCHAAGILLGDLIPSMWSVQAISQKERLGLAA